jgi:hypothetical protein
MGFAFNLGTKIFRYWGGTAAMISTRRGCAERPCLAAVLVFNLKVKHLALPRSECFKHKLQNIIGYCHSLPLFHRGTKVALRSVNIKEIEEQNLLENDLFFSPSSTRKKPRGLWRSGLGRWRNVGLVETSAPASIPKDYCDSTSSQPQCWCLEPDRGCLVLSIAASLASIYLHLFLLQRSKRSLDISPREKRTLVKNHFLRQNTMYIKKAQKTYKHALTNNHKATTSIYLFLIIPYF